MQTLRLRGLTPGQEYTFPVRIRKVLEIKDKHNLFTSPAHYWVSKKDETIPTTHTLRVRKTEPRYVRPFSPDIVPISRREVSPVDLAEVSRVVETIVREHSIPENAYLVIDYGVETSLGRFVLNLWWFPQDTKIFMKYTDWRPTLEEIGRSSNPFFYMPTNIIAKVIGHENIKQVYGPPLRFEWERNRTRENRNYQRARMPAGMVPYWLSEAAGEAEEENDEEEDEDENQARNIYNNIPNVGTLNIPAGSTNVVSLDDIREGDEMVNFHGEHGFGRYYKQSTFNQLPIMNSYLYKKNPTTRATITRNNVRKYKAHLVGGKRKAARKTRRNRKA